MLGSRTRRFALVLAALLPPAALPAATTPPAQPLPNEPPSATVSLAGQLLVATPDLKAPLFFRTVILMVRHDEHGAFGLVINRPIEKRSLASLMKALGEAGAAPAGSIPVFAGGPVQPELGFIVHSTDYRLSETLDIDGRIAVTAIPEILRAIGRGEGPKKRLFILGYAGWGPGQLEDEIARHFWFTTPADAKLVFDIDRDRVWEEALARRARDL
jgi:putative transcriptional regulator